MNVIKLSAIGSTNDYLKALCKETDLQDGTVVLTEEQTQGRGQMGATWFFEPSKSLAFSVLKRFDELSVASQFAITMQVSLSIKNCLEQFGIPQLSIKWPNDIMADGKKLCGLLIENQLLGQHIKHTVIGVGLNVNNTIFSSLPKATSMVLESGNHHDLDEVFFTLGKAIINGLEHKNPNFESLQQSYEKQLFRKNEVSVFLIGGSKHNGIIRGVNTHGELQLQLEDEEIKTYRLKEVRLLN